MSLREKILGIDDLNKKLVFVKEWGVEVGVRSMTGIQRAEVLNLAMSDGKINHDRLHPEVLIRTVYDPETGDLIFTEDDKPALMKKNAAAIEALVAEAMAVSGLGAKSIEDIEKNSDSDTQN